MLHLLLGQDWTANREEILKRIAADVKNRQGNRILMVPELISHDTERRLCAWAGDTASRYAEVLSFTRLARRVADTMGSTARECLDGGGRVVAMAAAARQLSSRLKAYAAVETKPEFLTGLIDAVDEFKRCCISSQDLAAAAARTQGSLAQKLEELSLLMESYDALCARGKRDPRDQMTWLLEQLEDGDFGQTHVFYIDGFPDFTRQNLAILEHLIRVSPSVTVSLNCDGPDSRLLAFEKAGDTAQALLRCAQRAGVEIRMETVAEARTPLSPVRERLFQGPIPPVGDCLRACHGASPYLECLDAAKQVMALVENGCRYRDVALVVTDMTVYEPLLKLIFHRFHIPLYQAGTEEILQKSVIATVLTALDAALSGFDQRSTLRYLRSALSPLDPDTCDLVENYVFIWGIRGQKWLEKWEYDPDGLGGTRTDAAMALLEKLNEAREEAIGPLSRLQRGFREAKDLRGQIGALTAFLEEIRLEERLEAMAEELDAAGENREAQILNQLWEILISAMEQMHDVLGETYWEAEHFSRLFRLLLSQYNVGTIPPVLDAVQMGPVTAMRCNQQDHLIVLGAQEGNLPGYSGSAGVLTDQERVVLRELGVPLTGGAMEGIQAEFAEIYGVFCGAGRSIQVSYSGEQPSFVFRRLADMAGTVTEIRDELGFAQADDFEAGAYLARWQAEDQARELGAEEAYREVAARRDYSLGEVSPEHIRGLYGSTLNLSASQVDKQAECRLAYFLRYGLRAKERKEITVDPAEYGMYVHYILENTCRSVQEEGGFHKVDVEQTRSLAHRFSDLYAREHFGQLESERVKHLFNRNLRELDMIIEELWEEMSVCQFTPEGFEVHFEDACKGSEEDQEPLPPIPIPNSGMNAVLRGVIDRIDVWHPDVGRGYYRVVDYKTGKKSFDYCDVFNGVGLQMLLYLFALKESGSELLQGVDLPAGVLYFPARAPYLTTEGRSGTEAAAKRKSEWKRKGLLLDDQQVLEAMEPGDKPQRLCYTVSKKGISGSLADREQMKLLEGYVFRVLAGLVEDIASGNVEPNPYTRGSSHDACAFCPYGPVCHPASVTGRRQYAAMKAEDFWEKIGEEMERHGR